MTATARLALAVAAVAGLAAGAATDGCLAAVGAARVDGLQVGVAAAPLLALALPVSVRRELVAGVGPALLFAGSAWMLAPLVDQHLTRAVVVDAPVPDLIHHLAGWPAVLAGARLVHRPKATRTS